MVEEVVQTQQALANNDSAAHGDSLATLKRMVNDSKIPAFLCTSIKADNPNYLSIILGNKLFCEEFEILPEDLIGNSYDFLFDNIDINYSFDKNPDNFETYILNTKILSENLDIFISKYPSSARYVLKHNPDMDVNKNLSPENKKSFCRLIATHNHKKARTLLFNIINERAPSWWD